MADEQVPVTADRLTLLADRLISQFGARAWEVALSQRNQAAGDTRTVWTAIADRIAVDPVFTDLSNR